MPNELSFYAKEWYVTKMGGRVVATSIHACTQVWTPHTRVRAVTTTLVNLPLWATNRNHLDDLTIWASWIFIFVVAVSASSSVEALSTIRLFGCLRRDHKRSAIICVIAAIEIILIWIFRLPSYKLPIPWFFTLRRSSHFLCDGSAALQYT